MRRWLAAAMLIVVPAQAQTFSDDFEGPSLTQAQVPPGNWTRTLGVSIGRTVTLSASAARDGNQGLRIEDSSNAGTGTQVGPAVEHLLSSIMPNAYLRFWVRLGSGGVSRGSRVVLGALDGPPASTAVHAQVEVSAGTFALAGTDVASNYQASPVPMTAVENVWYLIELGTTGGNSANGTRTLWINGQFQTTSTGLSFSGASTSGVLVGETFGDGEWAGVVDFDNVRVSTSPMASRLVLNSNVGSAKVGDCISVTADLAASAPNGVVPADRAFTIAVASNSLGAIYANNTCSGSSVSAVDFAFGVSSVALSVRANTAGRLSLSATHSDLLPGSWSTEVLVSEGRQDAGSGTNDGGDLDAGRAPLLPREFQVACSCSTSSASLCLVLALPGVLRRRRLGKS